jgi:hypothetical protein
MATWTDRTTFRTISEDGELIDEHGSLSNGYSLADFEEYTLRQSVPGSVAQWITAGEDGDVLAEAAEHFGLVVYPAASIFD